MRKLIAVASFVGLLLTGGLTDAFAGHEGGGPGPNGHNNHGLCTAYFNGSDQGRAKKRENGQAFIALEEEAEAAAPQNNDDDPDNDISGQEAVEQFCGVTRDEDGNVTSPGIVGGNPDFDEPTPNENGGQGQAKGKNK